MPRLEFRVKVSRRHFKKFGMSLKRQLKSGSRTGTIGRAKVKTANAMFLYLRKRYRTMMLGGVGPLGEVWAPLSPRTIRRKKNSKILFETGQFMNAFRPRQKGSSMFLAGEKISVGMNKKALHTSPHTSRSISFGDLLEIHAEGSKRLPARSLIPEGLDNATLTKIGRIWDRALSETWRRP